MDEQTLYVRAFWDDRNAWQSIVTGAGRQCDDATTALWWGASFALPLVVEARDLDAAVQWRTRTDAVRALEAPINRPRCELQATYRALGAVLRLGGTGGRTWNRVLLDIVDSHYVATNATLPRLNRWYKNGYRNIANRDLWEQVRHALARLQQNNIECGFVLRDYKRTSADAVTSAVGDGRE